ncbi:MAG: ABC transporter ATP-binding protein [Bacteroidales bacterium]|nr:ABC transporter ATP-binding protein [Bacteroidales bacterium]
MLRLSNLNIGYNDSAPVVTSIDAELSDGCFCCLLGRNGTGKSTLLRTIAGLQLPLDGTIERPDSIGIVLTGIPNLLNTKVREMVAYGRLAHTGIWGRLHDEDYVMADEAIRLVGIQDIADRLLSTLSDGEKQKTMIARAIAQQSPLLLLDEPSAFLDYPSRRELMHLLQDLAHNHRKIILLSTHDVELAAASADILWIINDKTMVKKNPQDFHPEEL